MQLQRTEYRTVCHGGERRVTPTLIILTCSRNHRTDQQQQQQRQENASKTSLFVHQTTLIFGTRSVYGARVPASCTLSIILTPIATKSNGNHGTRVYFCTDHNHPNPNVSSGLSLHRQSYERLPLMFGTPVHATNPNFRVKITRSPQILYRSNLDERIPTRVQDAGYEFIPTKSSHINAAEVHYRSNLDEQFQLEYTTLAHKSIPTKSSHINVRSGSPED